MRLGSYKTCSSTNKKKPGPVLQCIPLLGLSLFCSASLAEPDSRTSGQPPFSTQACYARYFPLALKIADSMIPAEVRFFCTAPWDFDAFQRVKDELVKRKFDIADAFARASVPSKQGLVRSAIRLNQQAAESGPPGLPATWYIHKILPALHALKFATPDEALVTRRFAAADVAIMRTVADAIDWKRSALAVAPGMAPTPGERVRTPTLADVPRMILASHANPTTTPGDR